MWTAGIAGVVMLLLIGGLVWAGRRSGTRAKEREINQNTLDVVNEIDDKARAADREIDDDLSHEDYRDRLIARHKRLRGEK